MDEIVHFSNLDIFELKSLANYDISDRHYFYQNCKIVIVAQNAECLPI